ncbi:hypothetical protein ACOZ35_03265 [Halorubrum xinjiangense]|uniref:hypothetical protein n=1 Tax=Halorubrum xinjiangense TaxID=261291 RepID=UPI003C6F98A3
MDTTPFEEYVEEAEAVARTARKRNGLDWEVYVSETHTRINWYKQTEEQFDGPSLQFDGGTLSIEISQGESGWTNRYRESGFESFSGYDELDEAVESAYKVMMKKKPGDVFIL